MNDFNLELITKEIESNKPGSYHFKLGKLFFEQGNFYLAKEEFESALYFHRASLNLTHPIISEDLTLLGSIHWNLDDMRLAQKFFFEALEIDTQNYHCDHRKVVRNLNNLGLINKAYGRIDQAIKLFERVLISTKSDNQNRSLYYVNLGLTHIKNYNYKDAKELIEKAVAIDTSYQNEIRIAKGLMYLGYIQKDFEKPKKILEKLYKAFEIFDKNNKSSVAAYCLTYMGDNSNENMDTRKKYYTKAIQYLQKVFDDNHPDIKTLNQRIYRLFNNGNSK
jgi:tetratricopeptide (TPR) repeat protein